MLQDPSMDRGRKPPRDKIGTNLHAFLACFLSSWVSGPYQGGELAQAHACRSGDFLCKGTFDFQKMKLLAKTR